MFTKGDLIDRIERIERILETAGLFREAGDAVMDATWYSNTDHRGRPCWSATFKYRCSSCKQVHEGSVSVPASAKDGHEYEVTGSCGYVETLQIWKNKN